MPKMAAIPIYGKKSSQIFFKTKGLMTLGLDIHVNATHNPPPPPKDSFSRVEAQL